ncbi:MAG: phosphatase PAP2 family protein [Gemmatimonadaceae bacterium]
MTSHSRAALLIILAAPAAAPAGGLMAQSIGAGARDSLVPAPTSASLFRRGDANLLVGAFAMSAAVSFYDERISHEVRSERAQSYGALRGTATAATAIGGAGPIALALGTYLAGRLTSRPALQSFGRSATAAVVTASALTLLSKGIAGRERPSAGSDEDVFHFGRGFSGGARGSFPSGHTSASFALATVAVMETPSDRPRLRVAVGAIAFGAATLVGAARVYQGQHWTSDVISGAALGIVSGLMAERYTHRAAAVALDSPRADRFTNRVSLGAQHQGLGLSIAFR